eukprot:TRINITY_DN401_c0_g1_i2.p1 TRINITY_DN401_c0_g1~~TRINITY_DN401_c0_g1_i2.p1  ORF type:complete len:562 (+),score=172.18 TRINITY_DN401_c0_g1_i2:84-1688(+)
MGPASQDAQPADSDAGGGGGPLEHPAADASAACDDDIEEEEEEEMDDEDRELESRLRRLGTAQAVFSLAQIAVSAAILVIAAKTTKANDRIGVRNIFTGCVGAVSGVVGIVGGALRKELATRLFFVFQLWMLSTTTMYLYVGVDNEGVQQALCTPQRSFSDTPNSDDCSSGLALDRTKIGLAGGGLLLALLSCLVAFDLEDALDDYSDKQKALRLADEIAAADKFMVELPKGQPLSKVGVTLLPRLPDIEEQDQAPPTVAAVQPGSAADDAGVAASFELVEVNGVAVTTHGQLENALVAPTPTGSYTLAFKRPARRGARQEQHFIAEVVAANLHKAMKGLGTNERQIYRELGKVKTQRQWGELTQSFAARYPDFNGGDLLASLEDELSDKEFLWALQILEQNRVDPYAESRGDDEFTAEEGGAQPTAPDADLPPLASPLPQAGDGPADASAGPPAKSAADMPPQDSEGAAPEKQPAELPPPQPEGGDAALPRLRSSTMQPIAVDTVEGRRSLQVAVLEDTGDGDSAASGGPQES